MKILKAMVFLDAPDGTVYHLDAIELEGEIWFVPDWIGDLAKTWQAPVRIVSVAGLQHQKTPGSPRGDILVNEPISKAILYGQRAPEKGSRYRVVESPEIRIPIEKKT